MTAEDTGDTVTEVTEMTQHGDGVEHPHTTRSATLKKKHPGCGPIIVNIIIQERTESH